MRIFKTRLFARWSRDEGVSDSDLSAAIDEMLSGLIDADLGGCLFKKRIRLRGRGKRGGARTLIALRLHERAFFLHGFAKNTEANVNTNELRALKRLARELLGCSDGDLATAIEAGELIEVEDSGK